MASAPAKDNALAEFCRSLRHLCRDSGASQSSLARRLGLSPAQVSAILNGKIKQPPDWPRVEQIVTYCAEVGRLPGARLSLTWWRSELSYVLRALETPADRRTLRDYRRAVITAAGEPSYRIFPMRPSVGPVARLPLSVRAVTRRTLVNAKEAVDAEMSHLGIAGLEAREPDDGIVLAPNLFDRRTVGLLLVGGPGSGKTTLTRDIAAHLAEHPSGLLPIWVTARDLAARSERPWRKAVIEAAMSSLGSNLDDELSTDLLDGAARLLIIVDGLDEVPDDIARSRLLERLGRRVQQGGALFLLATRPTQDLSTLMAFGLPRYDVSGFKDSDLETLATAWLGSGAYAFLSSLRATALYAIARTPLFALIALNVYIQGGAANLPTSRFELVWRYLDHVLDFQATTARKLTSPRGVGALLNKRREELLEHVLADHLLGGKKVEESAAAWLATILKGRRRPANWRQMIFDILTSTGFLVEEGRTLTYSQYAFAEFFAARHLARRLPTKFRDDLNNKWYQAILEARDGRHAHLHRLALVTFTHMHPTQATPLMHYLTSNEQKVDSVGLAGLLIMDGVHVSPKIVERFIARAAPSIQASWLDRYLPHAFRVITTLSYLALNGRVEASSTLRHLANRPRNVTEDVAIAAAYALAASSPDFVGEAAALLQRICWEGRADHRLTACRALAALGGNYTVLAVQELSALADLPPGDRMQLTIAQIARAMLDQGDRYLDRTLRLLRRCIADERERFDDQCAAAAALAALGRPDLRDEAASWLIWIIESSTGDIGKQLGAARTLLDITGRLESGSMGVLAEIANEAGDTQAQACAASVLARANASWHQRAAELFMIDLETQVWGSTTRMIMAPILADEVRPYAAVIVPLLRERARRSSDNWTDLVGRLADEILDHVDPDSPNWQLRKMLDGNT